jgi:hypothetical protein
MSSNSFVARFIGISEARFITRPYHFAPPVGVTMGKLSKTRFLASNLEAETKEVVCCTFIVRRLQHPIKVGTALRSLPAVGSNVHPTKAPQPAVAPF